MKMAFRIGEKGYLGYSCTLIMIHVVNWLIQALHEPHYQGEPIRPMYAVINSSMYDSLLFSLQFSANVSKHRSKSCPQLHHSLPKFLKQQWADWNSKPVDLRLHILPKCSHDHYRICKEQIIHTGCDVCIHSIDWSEQRVMWLCLFYHIQTGNTICES
jgi:hypothetical protein